MLFLSTNIDAEWYTDQIEIGCSRQFWAKQFFLIYRWMIMLEMQCREGICRVEFRGGSFAIFAEGPIWQNFSREANLSCWLLPAIDAAVHITSKFVAMKTLKHNKTW